MKNATTTSKPVTAKGLCGFSGLQVARANVWLKKQWAIGKIPKPEHCQACGQIGGLIKPFTEDYHEPFGEHIQSWTLCFRCEYMARNQASIPEALYRYKAELRHGYFFAGLKGNGQDDYNIMASYIAGDSQHIGIAKERTFLAVLDMFAT